MNMPCGSLPAAPLLCRRWSAAMAQQRPARPPRLTPTPVLPSLPVRSVQPTTCAWRPRCLACPRPTGATSNTSARGEPEGEQGAAALRRRTDAPGVLQGAGATAAPRSPAPPPAAACPSFCTTSRPRSCTASSRQPQTVRAGAGALGLARAPARAACSVGAGRGGWLAGRAGCLSRCSRCSRRGMPCMCRMSAHCLHMPPLMVQASGRWTPTAGRTATAARPTPARRAREQLPPGQLPLRVLPLLLLLPLLARILPPPFPPDLMYPCWSPFSFPPWAGGH